MPTYYKGSLCEEQVTLITNLLETEKVEVLRHIITDLPEHSISEIIAYAGEASKVKEIIKEYPRGTLTDEQTKGVAFMFVAEAALLGDSVGLGKTVQIAGLVNLLKKDYANKGKSFKFCFLGEKTSIPELRRKLIQFTGDYVDLIHNGELKVVSKYVLNNTPRRHFSVVGSHSLLNSSEFLVHCAREPFDLIIIDESSVLKNRTTTLYKNAKILLDKQRRKILLNATPFENNAKEFYTQLALLDPTYLPSLQEFHRLFCKMGHGVQRYQVVGYKRNVSEFKQAVSLRYLARTREDLKGIYEGNSFKCVSVPQSTVQKKLNNKTTLHQMLADYPPGVDFDIPFSVTTTPKASALLGILSEIGRKERVLVYCRFVACQHALKHMLEEQGYKVGILNGQDTKTTKARSSILKSFAGNEFTILITNVQRSLDLNFCNYCVLYTIEPNPQKMVQFEGRITRTVDIKNKHVYLLASQGREIKYLKEVIKARVLAGESFVNMGRSLVLDAIKAETTMT